MCKPGVSSGAKLWLLVIVMFWTLLVLGISVIRSCRECDPVFSVGTTYCPTMLAIKAVQATAIYVERSGG